MSPAFIALRGRSLRLARALVLVGTLSVVGLLVLWRPPIFLYPGPSLVEEMSAEQRAKDAEILRLFGEATQSGPRRRAPGQAYLRAVHAQESWALIEERYRGLGTAPPETPVGLYDYGFAPDHPDLRDILTEGVLDDGLGMLVWRAVNDGHGSGLASVIAARQGEPGMLGVNPMARLVPFSYVGDGDRSLTAALQRFVAAGARVGNFSLADPRLSVPAAAVERARRHGLLLVAGLQNDHVRSPVFPAYADGFLVVSGVDVVDGSAPFGYGETLDVLSPSPSAAMAAPFLRAGPLMLGHPYRSLCCNSMATAIVSGVASLLSAYDPSLTSWQLEKRLKLSAARSAAIDGQENDGRAPWDEHHGYGRIDALAALSYDRASPSVEAELRRRGGRLELRGQVVDDVDDERLRSRGKDRPLLGIPTSNVLAVEYRLDRGPWRPIPVLERQGDDPAQPAFYVRRFTLDLDEREVSQSQVLTVRALDSSGNVGQVVLGDMLQ